MNLATLPDQATLTNALQQAAGPALAAPVKLMFVPPHVDDQRWETFIQAYARLVGLQFEIVVIVEEVDQPLDKKISMPSMEVFNAHFGPVPAHDGVRNEFADEDDDLYVDDAGVHEHMALYDQLPFLQSALGSFSVVSVQLYKEERPSIIKELAYVIEEILGERSALVIFCCELLEQDRSSLPELKAFIHQHDVSNLFNILNSGQIPMTGHGPFIAGVLVSQAWNLELQFIENTHAGALVAAHAVMRSS
jgi:AmmeMemoRadiSam system protein B